MKNIIKALLEAQKQMGNAIKDSKNPYFKSKYADLNSIREACMPILNQNGIVVLQPTVNIEGRNYVKTLLLHESGEALESLTEIIYSKQNDAQAQGSGITYARRYGLQSLINIGAEDDDGNAASKVIESKQMITPTQISIIEGLIQTSTLDDSQIKFIQNNMLDCTAEEATKWIEKLKSKQVDPIESGNNYTQTDIKNKLKQIK